MSAGAAAASVMGLRGTADTARHNFTTRRASFAASRHDRSGSLSSEDSDSSGVLLSAGIPYSPDARAAREEETPPDGRPDDGDGLNSGTTDDDHRGTTNDCEFSALCPSPAHLGPLESAVRKFIEWQRTQSGATTIFGATWFLASGLLNALATNSDLQARVGSADDASSEFTQVQQLVAGLLVALQVSLLLVFFMGFEDRRTRWVVYRRFLLLQGLVWLLRAATVLAPGLSKHSRLILNTELSISTSPAARLMSHLRSWSYQPFTGHASDFVLLGMLWHRFQRGLQPRLFMWTVVSAALLGLLFTHPSHRRADVCLGALMGALVVRAYDAYLQRVVLSLQQEGPAAQHRGWLKPFLCWYEAAAPPMMSGSAMPFSAAAMIPPKKYRVIAFKSRRNMSDVLPAADAMV